MPRVSNHNHNNAWGSRSPFDGLPVELKELVWQYAMPEPLPEVALLPSGLRPITPLGPRPNDEVEHSLVINTAYPVLMHVCREWRAFAQAKTSFRYSQVALMEVPTRPFQPDLDVLYIPAVVSNPVWFSRDSRCQVTRHIAMQSQTFLNYGARSLALMTYFRNMETLTIVLPSSAGRHSLVDTFPPPTARCRLRRIPRAALDDANALAVIQDCGPGGGGGTLGQVAKVSAFLCWVEATVDRTSQYLYVTQELGADELGQQPRPCKALAQTFVEYRYRNGAAEWDEVPGAAC